MCVRCGVVSWTQQFRMAARRITTWFGCACATGDAADLECAGCLLVGLPAVPRCCALRPEEAGAAFGDDDTTWYTTKPTSSASAMTMAALQFGLRLSLILIGVAGSNTSPPAVASGAPLVSPASPPRGPRPT